MTNQNNTLVSGISAKKKKNYSPQFKLKLAIEAIKNNSLSEISRQYNVGPNVIYDWKKLLLEQGEHIFETTPNKESKKLKSKIAKLEQMIGKKEIELNLIKNFSDFYQSQNTS